MVVFFEFGQNPPLSPLSSPEVGNMVDAVRVCVKPECWVCREGGARIRANAWCRFCTRTEAPGEEQRPTTGKRQTSPRRQATHIAEGGSGRLGGGNLGARGPRSNGVLPLSRLDQSANSPRICSVMSDHSSDDGKHCLGASRSGSDGAAPSVHEVIFVTHGIRECPWCALFCSLLT